MFNCRQMQWPFIKWRRCQDDRGQAARWHRNRIKETRRRNRYENFFFSWILSILIFTIHYQITFLVPYLWKILFNFNILYCHHLLKTLREFLKLFLIIAFENKYISQESLHVHRITFKFSTRYTFNNSIKIDWSNWLNYKFDLIKIANK